ncbi:orexin receptor type 2-like isoform X2 [Octopus vulgaris]|uniref:Orexin receptor type 2-like isoform X2 n=1 Tax=Octopus vulgaris TaxID=6645 RepID=A0AA36AHK4_OCTVU|nr:orexin receptor type 2-like isoform X2 [Octopus vulgaris]
MGMTRVMFVASDNYNQNRRIYNKDKAKNKRIKMYGNMTGNGSVGSLQASLTLAELNDLEAQKYLLVIIFVALLMLVGTPGNILVLYIYRGRFKRVSTSNYFIEALAIFDLIACMIGMPTEVYDLRYPYMFSSDIGCKILRFSGTFTVIGSSMILLEVAVDRYWKVCKPHDKMSVLSIKIMCGIAAIVGLLIAVPSIFYSGVKPLSGLLFRTLVPSDIAVLQPSTEKAFRNLSVVHDELSAMQRKTSSTFVPRRFKLNEERIKHHLRQDASKKETKSSKCNIPDPKNGSNSLSNNKSNNKECRRQYCAKSLSNSINSSTVSLESTPIITKQMVERGTMACMPHLYTISMEKSQARRKDHIILKDHNGHCVGYAIPLDTRKWVAESRDEQERNSSMSSIISYDQNNIDKREQQIVKTSHITNSTPSYTDHGPHRLKPTVLYIHSDIHQKNIRNSRLNPNTRHRKGVTKEYTFNQGWGILPQAKKLTGWIPHSRPMRNNNTSTQ